MDFTPVSIPWKRAMSLSGDNPAGVSTEFYSEVSMNCIGSSTDQIWSLFVLLQYNSSKCSKQYLCNDLIVGYRVSTFQHQPGVVYAGRLWCLLHLEAHPMAYYWLAVSINIISLPTALPPAVHKSCWFCLAYLLFSAWIISRIKYRSTLSLILCV